MYNTLKTSCQKELYKTTKHKQGGWWIIVVYVWSASLLTISLARTSSMIFTVEIMSSQQGSLLCLVILPVVKDSRKALTVCGIWMLILSYQFNFIIGDTQFNDTPKPCHIGNILFPTRQRNDGKSGSVWRMPGFCREGAEKKQKGSSWKWDWYRVDVQGCSTLGRKQCCDYLSCRLSVKLPDFSTLETKCYLEI